MPTWPLYKTTQPCRWGPSFRIMYSGSKKIFVLFFITVFLTYTSGHVAAARKNTSLHILLALAFSLKFYVTQL